MDTRLTDALQRYINATYVSGGVLAHSIVARAILKGTIESPRKFKCVDCGRDASCYDHRDYSRPLDVIPVCRSCNCRRGKAAPKLWGTRDEFVGYMTTCTAIKRFQNWYGFDIEAHAFPVISRLAPEAKAA